MTARAPSPATHHRPRPGARPLGLLSLLALLVAAPAAPRAAPRRSIAVLEFRQDVSALPGIADRMAQRIAKLTGAKVLGPVEARQQLGALVDGFVARCQGDPRCVGAIGTRLGVSEVILIGMSSLGDVIIQISRIDATSRQVLANVAHTMASGAELPKDALDKWIRRLLPAADFLRYGYIRIRSNREGAEVYLGQTRHGLTPLRKPIQVRAPSSHDIRVVKPGFVPFSAQVQVPPEATIEVNAALPPVPVGGAPYYRKWWFWTAIAGGVALVVGVTAGVTLGTRQGDHTVPAVVRW